ncbi:MAG: AraC-like DNA-binding protein [Francisellaceae bacterium]|jgi:AraC-like DNA-binding protein
MAELESIRRKLYIGINQSLYLGLKFVPHKDHAIVSDKLIVSLRGNIKITLNNGNQILSRSCLLKAGVSFENAKVNMDNAVMAVYYLAPLTQDYPALESTMTYATDGLHYNHPEQDGLIAMLVNIRDTPTTPEQAYAQLRQFIIKPHQENVIIKQFDKRIIQVVCEIRSTTNENLSLREFAQNVCLSESRLEKLFKEQMGIPITRYRLRYRVWIGIIHLALGRSITEAALAAGFASTAHFSKSFSAINGIPPSETFFKPPHLEVLIDEQVFENMTIKIDKNIVHNKNKTKMLAV